MEDKYRDMRRGSFFFPFALITVGVIWLLVNNGTIAVQNVYRLYPFWPVLIILAGISVLFRRFWAINLLLWGGAAALTIWLLTSGSAFLPQAPALDMKHGTFSEPVGSARSADVMLDLSINHVNIAALKSSSDLVTADVYYTGDMRLDSSGTDEKTVRLLHESDGGNFPFNPRIDQWAALADKSWQIGLSPAVPLKLTVDASTGSLDMNLVGLQLEQLVINASTGSLDLALPSGKADLPVRIDCSTGSMEIVVADETPVSFNIEASTGSLSIDVPSGVGLQVKVTDGGTGSLNLPDDMEKISGGDDKEGTYENDAFAKSAHPIIITIDMSTGSVNIY